MCFAFLYQERRQQQQQQAVVTKVSLNRQDTIQLDFHMCIHQGLWLCMNACMSLIFFFPCSPSDAWQLLYAQQHVVGCRNLSSGISAALCRNLRLLEFKAACTEPRAMRAIKMSSCLCWSSACTAFSTGKGGKA